MAIGTLAWALAWAARGFKVFPIAEGVIDRPLVPFKEAATSDPETIRSWWTHPSTGEELGYNYGVLTTGMVVVDVDVKRGAPGLATWAALDGDATPTLRVSTPSGGFHAYFDGPNSSGKQGVHGLGEGVDIRSDGNYVAGPGSVTAVGAYTVAADLPVAPVPPVIRARLVPPRDERVVELQAVAIDSQAAVDLARGFLTTWAPIAVEGQRGDDTTYRVMTRLRDFGVSMGTAAALAWELWNPRCMPPWSWEEIYSKARNAFEYATGVAGSFDPATVFADVVVPEVPPPPPSGQIVFGNALEPALLEPRKWLVERFLMRGQSTLLVAAGSAGKSSLALATAALLAVNKADVLGFDNKAGKPVKSVVINREDELMEQSRRLVAICSHYGLDYQAVRQNVALVSSEQFPFRLTEDQPPRLNTAHVQTLMDAASPADVGLVVLDPFVRVHTAREDDNVQMDYVISLTREFAAKADVALLIPHHSGKPSKDVGAGDAGMSRGASSIMWAARIALTLTSATREDCLEFGLPVDNRNRYVRLDDAKVQFSLKGDKPIWLKRHSVGLYNGDQVGVLAPHDLNSADNPSRNIVATLVTAMVAVGKASVPASEAVNLVRSIDALLNVVDPKMVLAQLETALRQPVVVEEGRTIRMVQELTGGRNRRTVILD